MGEKQFEKESNISRVINTLKREILKLKMNRKQQAAAHVQRNFKMLKLININCR